MEPCTQEGRITRIETAVTAIGEQVTTLVTSVNELKTKVEPVMARVEEHDRALYGNNGTVGIVAKVANSLEVLDDLKLALRGKEEEPGLIAVIKELSDKVNDITDERKWLLRLLIGAVLLFAVGGIYSLFVQNGIGW
jgi:hypothetical protein